MLNVATGVDISVSEIADRVLDALGKPRDLTTHVPERLGQVDRHIGSTEKMERPDRLARAHVVRRRARADDRLVPRERGLVERGTGAPERRRRRLLVLGAGAAQLGLLEAARALDLFVIAVDRDPAAPGFPLADRRAIISTEDEPGIERLAEAERSTA